MIPNPALGVFFHWIGGLASASFYLPYRGVKRWSWETYWLAGGIFSWLIAPWIMGLLMTKDLLAVLTEAPPRVIFWAFFFGLLWGVGGLTFGLTMRYLGLSLGMAMVLGLCATLGTLMPPIFKGEFMQVVGTNSGRVILLGIFVCLLGIAAAGLAGIYKERSMSPEQKKATITEFDLKKGIGVAMVCGIMSACFAYGLAAGDPIKAITLKHGTPVLWQGLPVLIVVLVGGFITNFVWCLVLNIRNQTGHQYFSSNSQDSPQCTVRDAVVDASCREMEAETLLPSVQKQKSRRTPMLANYLLCALAGTTWYFQFFFYSMGETQMGRYKFSSWTLHMASIIIFGSVWGIGFKEWKGAGVQAGRLLFAALTLLVGSTVVVGYGNYLGTSLKR
jgi:L-rhamnose-H+ transport protein